jgi:hypothetical protein
MLHDTVVILQIYMKNLSEDIYARWLMNLFTFTLEIALRSVKLSDGSAIVLFSIDV